MFQLFLRARARNFVRDYLGGNGFKIRSLHRDQDTDHGRIETVMKAIETVLSAAESEKNGLNARVEEVLARAAVTAGKARDEYPDRELPGGQHRDVFGEEISSGQERLRSLAETISHFKFLRAAVLSRFPDYKSRSA